MTPQNLWKVGVTAQCFISLLCFTKTKKTKGRIKKYNQTQPLLPSTPRRSYQKGINSLSFAVSHLLANQPLIITSYIFTCKSLESQACPISMFISHLQAVGKHSCTSTEGLTFNLPVPQLHSQLNPQNEIHSWVFRF